MRSTFSSTQKARRPRATKRKRTTRRTKPAPLILTIGHSTRAIGEFIELLRAHEVTRVVDVRTVPRSRHNPQFNREQLPASLHAAGISYQHCPALGGLRRTTSASRNTGWRNRSFRGYADYMQTRKFREAVDQLIGQAERDRLALMCAEAVPWRCHRSLIADALLIRGVKSEDISNAARRTPHRLTPFAHVRGTLITYPSESSIQKPKIPRRRSALDRVRVTSRVP